MIDHINIRVADYERSKKFYQAALAPLGYSLTMESTSGAGFSKDFIPDFWIKQGRIITLDVSAADLETAGCGGRAIHIALAAADRATVDTFYRAALAVGGRDNGAPRLCLEYHPNYYGAFILDPDGYNIEAVCHQAE